MYHITPVYHAIGKQTKSGKYRYYHTREDWKASRRLHEYEYMNLSTSKYARDHKYDDNGKLVSFAYHFVFD